VGGRDRATRTAEQGGRAQASERGGSCPAWPGGWQAASATASGEYGAIAAGHPAAAAAGAEMFARGGNAVDALVAAAFVSFVVEPHNCGLGGYGRLTAYVPARSAFLTVDHHIRAPRAAHAGMFEIDRAGAETYYGWPTTVGYANSRGGLAVGVPGAVAGLVALHERLGRLQFPETVEPAIAAAREGVVVDWEVALAISEALESVALDEGARKLLLAGGRTPKLLAPNAHRLRLDGLSDTLRRIAQDRTAGFYKGPVAHAMVRAVARRGGVLDLADLEQYKPKIFWEASETFGRCTYATADDAIAYQTLNMLQLLPYQAQGPDGLCYRHALAEVLAHAFADSMRHYGDPDMVAAPTRALRSAQYAASRARAISMTRAAPRPVTAGDPWPYEPQPHGWYAAGGSCAAVQGTSQVTAIDRDGLAASVITTIAGPFGSGVFVEEGGFFLNNGMQNFDPRPGRANSVAPGKMPIFAAPALVAAADGRAVLAVGGSGGYRIESAVLHTTVNCLTFGMSAADAASHPRVHCQGRETIVDSRIPREVRDGLAELGHAVVVVDERPWPVRFGRVSVVASAGAHLGAASWPAWSGGAAAT